MPVHVAVIGVVSSACSAALGLVRAGFRVTLIEPGGPQANSHGNGASPSRASVVPMSMPGLCRLG